MTDGLPATFEVKLVHAFDVRMNFHKRLIYGTHPSYARLGYVSLKDGVIQGPRLNGRIMEYSGADWSVVRTDGVVETDAHYMVGRKPVPGDTQSERVIYVLRRATRGMQGDANLTEALTRAFMFADASVATEIHVVGMQMTSMLTRAIKGEAYVEGEQPSDEDVAIARVISDVWLSALVSWVTGRATAEETAEHIETAVRLVLR